MAKRQKKPRRAQCHECGGHGIVPDYGSMAADFYGDKECPICEGTGELFVTRQGRLRAIPSGKLKGRI